MKQQYLLSSSIFAYYHIHTYRPSIPFFHQKKNNRPHRERERTWWYHSNKWWEYFEFFTSLFFWSVWLVWEAVTIYGNWQSWHTGLLTTQCHQSHRQKKSRHMVISLKQMVGNNCVLLRLSSINSIVCLWIKILI